MWPSTRARPSGRSVERYRRPLGQHQGALDQVLQLADVPWPRVAEQGVDRVGPDRLLGDGHGARLGLDEVADERDQVLAPLAQRRQVHGDHVQPVVEVGAEGAVLDGRRQVAVGGGDDAHVDAQRTLAADAQELARLEHAQELRLGGRSHLADLVEEERALVRQLELAELLRVRVGERAALVAEELALEQRLGDGGAVQRDELLASARLPVVDGLGDQLLAGAALAGDQHGGLARRDGEHGLERGLHARRTVR